MSDELTTEETGRVKKIEIKNFKLRFEQSPEETYQNVIARLPESFVWRPEWPASEVAFRLCEDDTEVSRAFNYLGLDPSSPISWRVIVELFAKAAFPRKGRPTDSTLENLICMAHDFNHVRITLLDRKWNVASVVKALLTGKLYRDRYDYSERHIRKLIKQVTDEFGPIDDELTSRLIDRYGHEVVQSVVIKWLNLVQKKPAALA